jgi:2'-5' RNA ligase
LPDRFRAGLDRWRSQVFEGSEEVRLPNPASLHVTLVFLGYQAERDVPRIAESTFAETPRSFTLRADRLAPVPPRRARLYALGLREEAGELAGWQRRLSDRLEQAGLYEPEKRPFWPHVTMARVRRPGRGPQAPSEVPDELSGPFAAGRVTLYRSTLRREGALYEPLASEVPAGDSASSRSEYSTG